MRRSDGVFMVLNSTHSPGSDGLAWILQKDYHSATLHFRKKAALHAWEGTSEVLLQRELCFWFGGGTRSRTSVEAEPVASQK